MDEQPPSGAGHRGRRPVLSGFACVVLGILTTAFPASAAGQRAGVDGRAAGLERELGPGVRVAVHEETGRVRFIGTAPGRPIDRPAGVGASASAADAAKGFLARYGGQFGLREAERELRVAEVRDGSRGRSSVRLQQLHDGVPVLGGELVVNLDRDRDVLSVSGEASPSPSLGVESRVSPVGARATALAAIAKAHGVAPAALRTSAPELWIYDPRLLGGPGPDRPRLAWRLEVTAPKRAIRELVLVDAQLGSVALHFNQIAHARNREICDANNVDADYPCTPAAAERSEGDPPTGVADVDGAYDFSGDTYDFFFDRFGRDSLDGAGMTLFSTVRYCPPGEGCPYENAFWDGEQMVYGEGFAVDDVVGHELSHGVTEFSSHLFYYYQSGAINESFSDVFGELIDLTNGAGTDTAPVRWLVGEDIPGIGAIRDMQDPPSFGDPDRMTSPNYTADLSEGDAGGVHANSGVNNKAAYLITDGDAFNGTTVTGLGIDKVARIYYEVETSFLTSASDYADLGAALEQACTNLIGTAGIGAADCTEVSDAVAAVEMEQDPPAAPAPEAPTCTSGSPVDVFFDDLENPASGNWVRTENVGSNEWYHPQNSHPYDFDATYATSGTTNFWGYDRPSLGDFSIEMASNVTVPAGGFMRFKHAYGFEDSVNPTRAWDGGVVEYSTNGGATWADAGPLFQENGYPGTIFSGGGANNPLKGRSAFVRESNGYISSRLGLSSLAGQQVRFRFRIGTDSIVDDYGWFIDDVRIYSCGGADTDPPETTITSGPSGPTNDSTPTFGFSSDEPGSSFECRFDSNPFAPCSGPGDTHTPAAALSEGAHTFEVRATDPAANPDPTPASRGFTVDTQAPAAPAITDTDPDSPANDNNPEVKGTAEAGSTVKLYESADCTGAVEAQGSAAAFNSPGLTAAVANDAATQFTATATDAAGNTSPCSAPFGYTEDSTPPTDPSLSSPSHQVNVSSNDSTVEVTFAGASDALSGVDGFSYLWDTSPTTTPDMTIDAQENATGTTSPPLADGGSHWFHLRTRDNAGNWTSTVHLGPFVIDVEGPAAPAITDTDPDSPANDNSPEVKGTAEAGSTVKLYESADCTGAVEAQGSAAAFNSPGLTAAVANDAATQFTATATDAASNTSPCSEPFGYTEDSTPPDTQIDSGPAGPTNDPTPTFTFSSADGGVIFACKENSGAFGACSGPGNVHTFPAQGDGPHSFAVKATDAAGNVDPTPASRAFTVDTADPSSLIAFPQDATAYTSANYAAGCTDGTPDVCGTASDGVGLDKVEVRIQRASDGNFWNGASWQAGAAWLLASGTTSWSFGFNPAEDTYTLSSRATDVAGNVESTATATFTIDDSAPGAPTITDTDPDSPANDNNPEVKGTAEAGSTVKLYESADCTGAVEAQGSAAAFNSPGLTAAVANDAATQFTATATDAAGNTSPCSAPFGYTEDSMVPSAPEITDTDPDSPADDNNPKAKGTVGEGDPTDVRVYTNGSCTGTPANTGSVAEFTGTGITVTVPPDATTQLSARAVDASNNASACSNPFSYTEDSTPPETQIDSGPSGPTNDPTPIFTFSSNEPGSTFECRFDSNPFAACSGPGSHTPPAGLPDGAHTFEVRATDQAGNPDPSPASRNFTVDTEAPAEPTFTGTVPASPANDNVPLIRGAASSTVRIYTTADCSGAVVASGASSDFADPGLKVTVDDDTTTTFRATAEDEAGNVSTCSSASIAYMEDSTPPTDPSLSSPSHQVNVPSADPTVEIAFTGAFDSLSGVDGFSYLWDASPTTTPDTVKDAEEAPLETTSDPLPDGNSHYFHLRTRDNAGNWTSTVHLGPFVIDTQPVSSPPTPPPPLILLPDSAAPVAVLAASPKQRAGGPIEIEASCDEPCTVIATGVVVAEAGGGVAAVSAKRKFKLRAARTDLPAFGSATLKLLPKGNKATRKKSAKALRKLVRSGAKAKAKIGISLTDRAGNSTSEALVVKLSR